MVKRKRKLAVEFGCRGCFLNLIAPPQWLLFDGEQAGMQNVTRSRSATLSWIQATSSADILPELGP